MKSYKPDRESALNILKEYVHAESLIRHALTVEAVMKYFAGIFNEKDSLKWSIIGLLHDVDYEMYPDKHCAMTRELLLPYGLPDDYIRAIESHGYKLVNDICPVETMEKVLYATDELTGLIAATAVLRPSKSIMDIGVNSVKKKWKQKGFAERVNRDVIIDGAQMLGMQLELLIEHTIKGMQSVAEEIGLKGEN